MLKLTHNNKLTGILREDMVYITFRTRKHYFIKYGGFGLSADILQDLRNNGCNKVRLIYTKEDSTQEVYETYPEKFYELGELWRNENQDYQRVLKLCDFNMDKSHQIKQRFLKEQQRALI